MRHSILFNAVFALAVSALPQTIPSTCPPNTHHLCCISVQNSNSPTVSNLLGLLGVVLQGVAVPVGLSCTSSLACLPHELSVRD